MIWVVWQPQNSSVYQSIKIKFEAIGLTAQARAKLGGAIGQWSQVQEQICNRIAEKENLNLIKTPLESYA